MAPVAGVAYAARMVLAVGDGTVTGVVVGLASMLALAACARSATETLDSVAVVGPRAPASGGSGAPAQPGAGNAAAASTGGGAQPPAANDRPGRPAQPAVDPSPPAPRGPAQCRLQQRMTVVSADDDSFVVAAAADGERFGVLWLHEGDPWNLRFRSFALDGTPLHRIHVLALPLTRPQAALVVHDGAFVAAWSDLGAADRIRVTTFADGEIARDVTIAGTARGSDPGLAIGEDGGLVLSWVNELVEGRSQRAAAVSHDGGASFDMAAAIAESTARISFASSTALPGAIAHAWVARTISPNRSALMYTRRDASGGAPNPLTLVEHDRYIYDTAIAVSAGRVAIATTDSRVNIGNVPLYLTLLEPDGTLIAEGIRLSDDHGHEGLDMAAGTRSFVILADAFVGAEAENRAYVRQFDLDGRPLFEPLQLTAAELPPGTRLRQDPRLVALGPDRYLAVWGERTARPQARTRYDLIAGIVDCSAE